MDPEPQSSVPGIPSPPAGGLPLADAPVAGAPVVPPPAAVPDPAHDANMQSFVNAIMDQSPHLSGAAAVPVAPVTVSATPFDPPQTPAVPPQAPPPPPPIIPSHIDGNKPKKPKTGAILAAILLLLITLPIGVYYISQQQTRVTEQRSCASGTTGACITPGPYGNTSAPPEYCTTEACCNQYKDRTCFWFASSKTCKCTAPTDQCPNTSAGGSGWGGWSDCHADSCICVETRYCTTNSQYYQIRQCSGCGACGSPTVPHNTGTTGTQTTNTPKTNTNTPTPTTPGNTSTPTPTTPGNTSTPTPTTPGNTSTPTPTTPGNTSTPTPTTPPANPQCDSSCSSDSDCPSDLKCYQIQTGINRCRKQDCPTASSCNCPVATPTPTPVSPKCNASCSGDSECPNNMVCYSGSCRNSSCLNETDCSCPQIAQAGETPASPTPKVPISGIPSVLGVSTAVGSILLLILGLIL